mgnify:CR=1 FL=1
MMRIPLTQGQQALIDAVDLPLVARYRWYASRDGERYYAKANVRVAGKWTTFRMHRLILGLRPGGPEIDHRNGNSLDNHRTNLRVATHSQNKANSIGQPTRRRSKYKGVGWHRDPRLKIGGRWRVRLGINGGTIERYAMSEVAAATLYNELAVRHFGEFARLNSLGGTP